jgi:nitroimidazol reductase NimA-like FMN-containing flavoprotein (pyridoxamine 5'-phosphate oxidase superfamily)
MTGVDKRVRLGRFAERGSYEFTTIAAILDEAMLCHVGVSAEDGTVVLPTIHARIGRYVYVHGSPVAKWMRALRSVPLCLTATIVDGIVLARSAFNHSLNYRSAVVIGTADHVDDVAERRAALEALVEYICPGRWNDTRQPTASEIEATGVLRVNLDVASAKVRTGPPVEFAGDRDAPHWAGVIPLALHRGRPLRDPPARDAGELPPYLDRVRSCANLCLPEYG